MTTSADTVRTRLESFLPAAERRYTRSGRALYDWILNAVPLLPLEAFGPDAAALRQSVSRAVRELTTNYYRARDMWTDGNTSQKMQAAQLMQDSAVIALALERDIRTHARRVPVIARWLGNATVARFTGALRDAANAGLGPLRAAASSFGMGAGIALGLGALLLLGMRRG